MKRPLFAMLVMMTACAHAAPRPPSGGLLPAAKAVLAIDAGGEVRELYVAPDGTVSNNANDATATVSADGELRDGETVLAQLGPDGKLVLPYSQLSMIDLRLRADGALVEGERVVAQFGAGGVLAGPMVDPADHIVAKADASSYRVLMLVWIGTMASLDALSPDGRHVSGEGPVVLDEPLYALAISLVDAGQPLPCDAGLKAGLHGVATEGGSPLSGATVVASLSGSDQGPRTELTDEHGCYAMPDLPAGAYLVSFYYADATAQQAVTIAAGKVVTVNATGVEKPR